MKLNFKIYHIATNDLTKSNMYILNSKILEIVIFEFDFVLNKNLRTLLL